MVELPLIGAFEAFRIAVRGLVAEDVAPSDVQFRHGDNDADDLFGGDKNSSFVHCTPLEFTLPRSFIELAADVTLHSEPQRFGLLYDFILRLREKPQVMADPSDRMLNQLRLMQKSVRRDAHKMKAFVRFKEVLPPGERRRFAAVFEPDHFVVEKTAPFFARRFADMDWVIATPAITARLENGVLTLSPATEQMSLPTDETDVLWGTYFSHIFNPARLKIKAMKSEMPVKYWKHMPEAALIPEMIADAERRAEEMRTNMPTLPPDWSEKATAEPHRPTLFDAANEIQNLAEAREKVQACTRCDLHCHATQAVFGEGPERARIMVVGEQPGDSEDLAGNPFVGPAGQLLNDAFEEAEIDRDLLYVTNAVKHFKFQPRGKRRIHQKPNAGEVQACKFWLDIEKRVVAPQLIVALGATATLALTGDGAGILKRRGGIEHTAERVPVLITVHPSSILRAPDEAAKAEAYRGFVNDLRKVKELERVKGIEPSS